MRKIKRRKLPNKNPYILIDANALAYSTFYTTGGLEYGGARTGVIFGFLKQIIKIGSILKSNNLIFCWDQGDSYRCLKYKKYKYSRRERYENYSPEEQEDLGDFLLQRTQLHKTILPEIGLRNSFSFQSYEGDDLIGQLVNQLHGKKIIVSDDNDLWQCLDRADIYLAKQKKLFLQKDFEKKYGVHPDQWTTAKAISGCSGDDIKGLRGIGDVKSPSSKALKYLKGDLSEGKMLSLIESKGGQRIIKRNIPLVTVPYLPDLMPRMRIKKNTVTRQKILRLFDKYRFISLMEKENFSKWKELFDL